MEASVWAKGTDGKCEFRISKAETLLTRCSWWLIGEHCVCDALVVVILHFDDLYAFGLVILRAVTDKQALTTANEWC